MLEFLAAFVLAPTAPVWLEPTWDGAPACVEAASLPVRVARLLGPDRVPPSTRVTLTATEAAPAWTIAIELESEQFRIARELRGDDCEVLSEAVALVIAVQVDPIAVADAVSVAAAPVAPAVPEPIPEENVDAPTTATEPVAELPLAARLVRPRATIGGSVAAELGVLPRSGATLALDVGVTWKHVRAEIGGLTSLGPDARPVDGVGARFRLFAGVVRGCGVIVRDNIEFPLCGGLEIGELWAKGLDLTAPKTVHALWLAPVFGLRPRWIATQRVALGAVIDIVAPIYRHRFSTGDAGFEHEVAPVVGRVGLGVEVRLP